MRERSNGKKGRNANRRERKPAERETVVAVVAEGEADGLQFSHSGGEGAVALSGSPEPYRSLVESFAQGALSLREDGTITYANGSFADTARLPLDRALGARLQSFLVPSDRPLFEAILDGREAVDREFTLLAADGLRRPIRIALRPLPQGGFAAAVSDLSEEAAIALFARQALEGRPMEQLVDEAARMIAGTLEVDLSVVLELAEGDTVVLAGAEGMAADDKGLRVELAADPHARHTLSAGEAIAVVDYTASGLFAVPSWAARHGVNAGLTAPVLGNGRPYGVIGAYCRRSRAFSRNDTRFIQTIANILAQAIKRKHAENDLRRSEEYYRSLIENVSEVISVLEPSGKLLFSSGSLEAVLGRRAETTRGLNVLEQHHPDHVERVRAAYSRALAAPGRPISLESRVRHEDGNWRDVEIVLQATTSLSGAPVLVSTMRDITERKRVEQERALLASIVESSDEAISSRDLEGRVTSWNPGAERLFGYPAAEMIGRPFGVMALPQDEMQANFKIVIETGRPQRFETRIARKDGTALDIATILSPLRDSNGNIAGAVLVTRDISERQLAQQALELAKTNAELEQFAYVASHDLKEPLRMIGGFANLLKRRLEQNPDDHEAMEFIGYILDGAQRSQELIDALLDYATLAPGSEEFEQVDVGIVVGEALAALEPGLVAADARVIRDPLPVVRGDRTLLAQLFQNLIGNAIKFRSPERPLEIRLSARRDDSRWVLGVGDNGIGIEPGHTDRIFNMFERLHNRKQFPGRGMGLAICRKAVERLGGKIWVESELERGSIFYFILPA